MGAHPAARLVAGATEIGVELNKKAQTFPCLISTEGVPELTRLAATSAAWRIGAAAPLTTIEEALAGEYPSLARMLGVFASRQIRNRATLGGNLATASPIGDSAPVLLTLDATLVLAAAAGERTVPLAEFFTGYRQTVLRPGEIIREIVLPRGGPAAAGLTRRADFLKVSKRRELDISIVAAAFCVDVDAAGVVRRARLAYGGVAATPRRARRAEAALEGRSLADATSEVAGLLATEFQPIDDVRGSAAYRRALVVSLWEKFVGGRPERGPGRRARFRPRRGVARHRRLARAAARERRRPRDRRRAVRGRPGPAPADARRLAGAARRTRGRGSSGATPPRRARAPGVVAVLLAEDIPGVNNVGSVRHDEPLLAADEVCYHGQMVALVVGESLRACRQAAALVEVDYEPLPAGAHAGRGGGAEQLPHGAARPRARRLRGGAGGGSVPAGGRVRARRAGALLPRDPGGLGRAGGGGRRLRLLLDPASVGDPGDGGRRARAAAQPGGGRSRRAWAAASGARRRRATRSPRWWRWRR